MAFMAKTFKFKTKVYYEDTDAGGIVYYANYLKFLERARTELVYALGFSHDSLKKDLNTLIVVKSCSLNFLKPAKFEDELEILSQIDKISPVRIEMIQKIQKNKDVLVDAQVQLATVDANGKPKKMVAELLSKFKSCISS